MKQSNIQVEVGIKNVFLAKVRIQGQAYDEQMAQMVENTQGVTIKTFSFGGSTDSISNFGRSVFFTSHYEDAWAATIPGREAPISIVLEPYTYLLEGQSRDDLTKALIDYTAGSLFVDNYLEIFNTSNYIPAPASWNGVGIYWDWIDDMTPTEEPNSDLGLSRIGTVWTGRWGIPFEYQMIREKKPIIEKPLIRKNRFEITASLLKQPIGWRKIWQMTYEESGPQNLV